jgi:transposase
MERRAEGVRLSAPERRALQGWLKHRSGSVAALRATVVLLSASGDSSQHIAAALGLSERTVRDCRRRWRVQGLSGLEDAPRPGRPKQVDAAFVRLLVRTVEKDPHELGYAFARWTNPRLAAYLAQQTGVKVSPKWIGELLRMHGFVWGKTKLTTFNLADPGEKKACRTTPESPPEGVAGAGGGLRAVVRRRRSVRPAAGQSADVAPQGPAALHLDPG